MPATAQTTAARKPKVKPRVTLRLVSSSNLPNHTHAADHTLLLASRTREAMERKAADKRRKKPLNSGELACSRIREFALDLGYEVDFAYGWKAEAARFCGLKSSTMWNIIAGCTSTIAPKTVDHVALKSGIPVGVFYESQQD